jgi:CheY-like chemotaxis protein
LLLAEFRRRAVKPLHINRIEILFANANATRMMENGYSCLILREPSRFAAESAPDSARIVSSDPRTAFPINVAASWKLIRPARAISSPRVVAARPWLASAGGVLLMELPFPMSGEIPTILIAEDDDGYAFLVEDNLRRAGVTAPIIRFADGQETLDFLFGRSGGPKFEPYRPYVLLLDIRMPA